MFLTQKFNSDGTLFPGIAVLCPKIPQYLDDDMCNAKGQYGQMFIAEMFGTFSFVSVCCMAKNFNGSKETIINAFACGLGLSFGIFIGGGISGGAINPAVGLVQSIF